MAGSAGSLLRAPPPDEEKSAWTHDPSSVPAAPREDFRVLCTSKRAVTEVVELCGRFVQKLGDALPERIREAALRDAQWTFESAVQENVSIGGEAWQEAPEDCFMDSDIKVLEDQFDEIIVDVATKRKQYPRKILECVIRAIKAKQDLLKQYHPAVRPSELKCDPDPAARLDSLKCSGQTVTEELSHAMKSLPAVIERADGLARVLQMRPVIQRQQVHREVFSGCSGKPGVTPESSVAQIEATPTETAGRKTTDLVLRRRRTRDCPQRRWYPLRPKRINLEA